MSECRFSLFLTFVLIFAALPTQAAPQDDIKRPLQIEPLHQIEDPVLTNAVFFNETQPQNYVGAVIGWLGGQVTKKLDSGSQTTYGLYYSWRDAEDELWNLQAHLLSSNAAWLQAGKYFLWPVDYRIWDSYYRLGLSHFIDPDEALAGLFRIDSFKATVAIGMLDIGALGGFWSAETGAHWGLSGLAFHIQSGFQWSF